MKDEIIICDCGSAEHQMVLRYDDDKDLGRMVYVEIHLVNKRWYERLWMGIKYIFGYLTTGAEISDHTVPLPS